MNILMIFHASPCPPEFGPARRHFHMLRELLKRHEISVLSFGAPEQREAFLEQFGGACREAVFVDNRLPRAIDAMLRVARSLAGRSALRHGFTRMLQRELDRLAERNAFDLIICSIPFLAHYRLPSNVPVISDTHNVEWLVMQRSCRETRSLWRKIYYYLQTRSTRRDEVEAARRVSALMTTSVDDMEVFREALPNQPIFVTPNGVDVSAYGAPDEAGEPGSLLFTGLMSYYPNEHGIEWFLDEILPLIRLEAPGARLIVAGARPSRWLRARQSEHVVVTGQVPDIRPFFARAQVFVAPLRIGGGTRVKILEAMAMRRPVVATSLACEGLDVTHGDSLMVADTPKEFAQAVIGLLRDEAARRALASRGRALIQARYDWAAIGAELEPALHAIARSHEAPAVSTAARSAR
jgi:glycosyltransferase involved in cell wall biosynthesis